MSQLSQLKREAKRLLNLAKQTQNQITIPNLTSAQKVIAYTNGYQNWHDLESSSTKERVEKEKNLSISQPVYDYLTDQAVYDLKRMYIDNVTLNLSLYNNDYQYSIQTSKIKGYQYKIKYIGYQIAKGLFSKNNVEIQYYKDSHLIVGDPNSLKSQLVKNLVEDCSDSNSSCVVFSDFDGLKLYQNLTLSEHREKIVKDIYYVSLLPTNNTSHSIDLINPLIDSEVVFKKSFDIKNNLLENIFLKLCQFYKKQNYALNSENLCCFLSLNWLKSFDKDDEIKKLICSYFTVLKISQDELSNELSNESFFNNYHLSIQEHHKNCYYAQSILQSMGYYEKKGVFSNCPQITFREILINGKHMIIDLHSEFLMSKNKNHKDLVEFIMFSYLNILKERNHFLEDNLHSDLTLNAGFSALTVIENINFILKEKNFNVMNDLLRSFKSPFFMFVSDLVQWEASFHQLLNHVKYYIFLKCYIDIFNIIPEICKNMLVSGKNGFLNIKDALLDIRQLSIREFYYWTNSHTRGVTSENFRTSFDLIKLVFNYRVGVTSLSERNLIDQSLINHPVLKKTVKVND